MNPFHGHFPIFPLLNSMVKTFGSHNITMSYSNLCYKGECTVVTPKVILQGTGKPAHSIGGNWGVSVDTTIEQTFLSTPACTACTDVVYSKELEHDVTTTSMAKAILRLKTLAFIPS